MAFFLAFVLALTGETAFADGKILAPAVSPVEVRIPDQRALLWWAEGEERLVIETRFTGEGTDFAWVVPLPSAPKVEAATRGLFPTLTQLMRPRLIDSGGGWFFLAFLLGPLGWLFIQVRPSGRLQLCDWLACAIPGAATVAFTGGFGITVCIFFGFVLWTVQRIRHGLEPRVPIYLGLLWGVLICAGFSLPVFGTIAGEVEIIDRQLAGVFETTTITGRDPAALRAWLNSNGYALPKEAEPVVADYLREGWVFVAGKVRRDKSLAEAGSLHPLSFTFAAREPVYPLRLTGVGNGDLEVDLFVFGPQRAKAAGFNVRECRKPEYRDWVLQNLSFWRPDRDGDRWSQILPMAHEGLRTAAPKAEYVTRLRGTLTPGQMKQDAVIQWDGTTEKREVLFSLRGALLTAIEWPGTVLCVFLLGIAAISRLRRVEPTRFVWPVLLASIGAAVATGMAYAPLPVVQVKVERHPLRSSDLRHRQRVVRRALESEVQNHPPITLEAARSAIQRALQADERASSSFQMREEDSPFNYALRSIPNGVEVLFYDEIARTESSRFPKEEKEARKRAVR